MAVVACYYFKPRRSYDLSQMHTTRCTANCMIIEEYHRLFMWWDSGNISLLFDYLWCILFVHTVDIYKCITNSLIEK